jgi:serine/threonine-protein kinase
MASTGSQPPGARPVSPIPGFPQPAGATPAPQQPIATPARGDGPQAPPDADSDPLIGTNIGSFKVVKKLGVGGMGTVYLGEQAFIGSKVAIKVLHPHLASNPSLVQRFYAEARAANVIGHEHIVNIIDLNLLPPNRYYFIMEYLEGKSLSELSRPMSHALLVHILSQVCDALQAAHEHGVVHRDLKPENVILIKRGRNDHFAKILDFGIAKLFSTELAGQRTAAGMIMGTPEFMAPEQTAAENVDGRTDLYSLGVIAYELATGKLPFTGKNVADLLIAHRMTPPVPPHEVNPQVPLGVSAAIMKALAKTPDERWQNADELREALEVTMEGVPPWRSAPSTSSHGLAAATRTGATPAFVPTGPQSKTPVSAPPGAPGYVRPGTGSNPAFVPSSGTGSNPAFVPSSGSTGSNPGFTPASSTARTGATPAFVPTSSTSGSNPALRAPTPIATGRTPAPVNSSPSRSGFVPTPAMNNTPAHGVQVAPSGVRAATPVSGVQPSGMSWEVRVYDLPGNQFRTLKCTDVSKGGMFLHTDGALPAMFARFKVALQLPDGEFSLKSEVVRHVTADQSKAWNMPVGFGVQFIELTPAQRDDLVNLARGLPRWQSAVQRADEKDDPKADELLATLKKRSGSASHYEVLGVVDDIDFPDVRARGREAKKTLVEARARPLSQ